MPPLCGQNDSCQVFCLYSLSGRAGNVRPGVSVLCAGASEALKGESLPEEAVSPEEMLAEDTRYFCEKTTLTESALEKLAQAEGVPAPERRYRLLAAAAVLRNLFQSEGI